MTCVHCAGMMYAAGGTAEMLTFAPVCMGSVTFHGSREYATHTAPETALSSRVYL